MATAKCKGNSREVHSVDDIIEFARENGYSQFVVLQDGNKVSPSNINFGNGEIQILPYDKWASVVVDFKYLRVTVPDGSRVEIKSADEVAIGAMEQVMQECSDEADYEEDEPDTSEAYEEDEPDTSGWL